MSYEVELSFPASPGGTVPFALWSEAGERIGSCELLHFSPYGAELAGWTVADEIGLVADGKSYPGQLGAPRQDAVSTGHGSARVFRALIPKDSRDAFLRLTLGETPYLFQLNLSPR